MPAITAGIIRIASFYSHALAKCRHPVRGRNSPRPECLRGDNRALGAHRHLRGDNSSVLSASSAPPRWQLLRALGASAV